MLGLVGGLLSSVAGGVLGLMGQNSANQTQEDLARTRYQDAVSDMKHAGLNPAMMFGSGGPAPMPNIQNPMAPMAQSLRDIGTSAIQTRTAEKTIDLLTEQAAKANAEAANTRAQLDLIKSNTLRGVRENSAVQDIPDAVYVPIVQGGWGADRLKSTGQVGAIGGAAAASAKSVGSGVGAALAPSGPALSSAKHAATEVGQALVKKAPELGDAVSKVWKRWFPTRHGETIIYKSDNPGGYGG